MAQMSLPLASRDRVSRHLSPESSEVRQMIAGSGRNLLQQCERFSRDTPFSRMLRACLVSKPVWFSSVVYLTWKVQVTTCNRLLYRLVVLTQDTGATGSGLWATPNTMDHLPPRSEEAFKKQLRHGNRKGRKAASNLREQINPITKQWALEAIEEAKLWPTPDVRGFTNNGGLESLKNHVKNRDEWAAMGYRKGKNGLSKLWPTPTENGNTNNADLPGKSGDGLRTAAIKAGAPANRLSPNFVEMMMHYPQNWTHPEKQSGECLPWSDDLPKTTTERGVAPRIKAWGNAVVPDVVARIGAAILEADK